MNSNLSYSPDTVKLGCDLCDLDLWPWPFAWTSLLSLVITPENFMMIRWWEHSQKGVTDGQTDRRTDRQTENTICRAAWSQLKIKKHIKLFIYIQKYFVLIFYCTFREILLLLIVKGGAINFDASHQLLYLYYQRFTEAHDGNSPVTQTSPEPTLILGRWTTRKIFPPPLATRQARSYRANWATKTLLFSKPLDLAQVCHRNKICSKPALTWKLTLVLAFPAHCISN